MRRPAADDDILPRAFAFADCPNVEPPLFEVGEGHKAACLLRAPAK